MSCNEISRELSRVPVICLPFAGAGASMFSEWGQYAAGRIEIVAPQLPGREKRFADPPYKSIEEASTDLFHFLREQTEGRRQAAFFGHSMGAILAYELARKFATETAVSVVRLFVSGCPAPWRQRTKQASGLNDQQFVDRVVEFAGYCHPALDDPEMRELLLPTLRADVEMHESYRPPSARYASIPITATRGGDDQLVPYAEVAEWQKASAKPFELVEMPGGHMYLIDHPQDLVGLIENTVARCQQEELLTKEKVKA